MGSVQGAAKRYIASKLTHRHQSPREPKPRAHAGGSGARTLDAAGCATPPEA